MSWPIGRPRSKKDKENIRKALLGIKRSAETIEKVSDAIAGNRHWSWKGGEFIDTGGYVRIWIGKNNIKHKHRHKIEKKIGRKLKSSEIVHHKNGIKTDNRLYNLELTTRAGHMAVHKNRLGK